MPFFEQNKLTLYCGDLRRVLPTLPENSVDYVVTDPPYGLGFMEKDWDHDVPGPEYWRAIARVCKPGALMLAFGGTRTYHRLICAIEDAGWEIRDCLMWLHSHGRPPSLDISKALDKAAGATREIVGQYQPPGMSKPWNLQKATDGRTVKTFASSRNNLAITAPATEDAKQWQGWGTNLRPGWEPIVLAMKPLDGTYAANVQKHGVAGMNIDACRIDTRWPSNVLLDEEAVQYLEKQAPGVNRFFYCCRASTKERGPGNDHPTVKPVKLMEYLLTLLSTPDGGVILDPFAGSGSTLLAAKRLDRRCIGVELTEHNCEIAKARLQTT